MIMYVLMVLIWCMIGFVFGASVTACCIICYMLYVIRQRKDLQAFLPQEDKSSYPMAVCSLQQTPVSSFFQQPFCITHLQVQVQH